MSIAEGMKSITDNIIVSYETRVETIEELVSDVQETLNSFADDRKKMSEEQAKELAEFVNDLTKEVGNLRKGFQKERKVMSHELRNDLAKAVMNVQTYVKNKLKEFSDAHADMSKELKKDLAKYVAGIVSETKKLLGDFAEERGQMADHWQNMVATLAEKRGIETEEEGEEKLGEGVEGGEAKPKKKKTTKSKGKK